MENPYETSLVPAAKTVANRRLISFGVGCLTLAVICISIGGLVLAGQFNAVSESSAPRPEELSRAIAFASPALVALPLGLMGIAIIVAGFVFRRPVDEATDELK